MKALVITNKGLEDVSVKEVQQLIKKKAEIHNSCISFDAKSEELCKLAYLMQSAKRVLALFVKFKFNADDFFDLLEKNISQINFDEWLDKNTSFKVECRREGEHSFSSGKVESVAGASIIKLIQKKKKYEQKVNLENPDFTFYIYIKDNECYLGVDFCGFDISKRDYKVFSHPASLKGPFAYSLVALSDYKNNKLLLDIFSSSGLIPIEAAYSASGFSIRHYQKDKFAFNRLKIIKGLDVDKYLVQLDAKAKREMKTKIFSYDSVMRNISSAKKNAKIAGLNKLITFSKCELDWLDTKFQEGDVDCLVAKVPCVSNHVKEEDMIKLYRELLYQMEYVLSKDGKAVFVLYDSELFEKFLENSKFLLVEKRDVWQGSIQMKVLIIKKKENKKLN